MLFQQTSCGVQLPIKLPDVGKYSSMENSDLR
jgi:hypothetical protein